jgi:hypothetical protein
MTCVTALLSQIVANQTAQTRPLFKVLHIIRNEHSAHFGPAQTLKANRYFAANPEQCEVFLEACEEERLIFLVDLTE